MQIFRCDHCGSFIFFENSQCTRCGHVLAFLPDRLRMAALRADGHSAAYEQDRQLCEVAVLVNPECQSREVAFWHSGILAFWGSHQWGGDFVTLSRCFRCAAG